MKPEVWIAGAALIVSVCAFWLSWRADTRGQVASRTTMFLNLRTRFLDVLEKLPPQYGAPDWDASSPNDRAAAIRYWHHSFDEWYVTTQLNEKLMRQLWTEYYSEAIFHGLKHNGLRRVLVEAIKADEKLAELWKDFLHELDRLWADGHPRDGTKCNGIKCNRHET